MKKEDILTTVKDVATVVVGAGVTACVGNVIRHAAPVDNNMFKKALCWTGTLVLSHMVADKAADYTNGKIDSFAGKVEKVLLAIQEAEKEATAEEEEE